MADDNKQQLQNLLDRLDTLPPQLRDAVFSSENADKLFEIGKHHELMIDKFGEMTHETGLLMLGVTHPDEFVGNLATRLEVDKAKAKTIADDINREIFAPVREHLRAMFGAPEQGVVDRVEGIETTKHEEVLKPPFKTTTMLQPEKTKISNIQPSAINHQPATSSLEDLEAELKKTIAEEHGKEPLNIILPSSKSPAEQKIDVPRYTGIDPYREQVEDTMPNTKGLPYKGIGDRPARHASQGDAGGVEGLEKKPKPQEKTSAPFSPLPAKQPVEITNSKPPEFQRPSSGVKPDGTLKSFRGINMAAIPQGKQTTQMEKKDMYREQP